MVAFLLNQDEDTDQVLHVARRLLEKVYTQEYNEFVQDKNQLTSEYAIELRDKKIFNDLCKKAQLPRLVEKDKMNYLLRYFQECQKQRIVPLPILFKVRDKMLTLKGYLLNKGLCLSLCQSLQIYPELLTGINLTDNGISDTDVATVLTGLSKLEKLQSITIRDNCFLGESAKALIPILQRVGSQRLEELNFTSLKTNSLVMT